MVLNIEIELAFVVLKRLWQAPVSLLDCLGNQRADEAESMTSLQAEATDEACASERP